MKSEPSHAEQEMLNSAKQSKQLNQNLPFCSVVGEVKQIVALELRAGATKAIGPSSIYGIWSLSASACLTLTHTVSW